MDLIHPESLSQTIDAVNEAMFSGRSIPIAQKERLATWIAKRHGQPGAYADTFALFDDERCAGIRLFTGERATNASARHIIGQEACRVLRWLDARAGRPALKAASEQLAHCVGPATPVGPKPEDGQLHWFWPWRGGTYCCGPCSVGLWRHLTAGGYDRQEARLARGLACLKTCRTGDGRWHVFPFWYTVSALIEMDLRLAREELRYAAPRLEAPARRASGATPYAARRGELARRALAAVL